MAVITDVPFMPFRLDLELDKEMQIFSSWSQSGAQFADYYYTMRHPAGRAALWLSCGACWEPLDGVLVSGGALLFPARPGNYLK